MTVLDRFVRFKPTRLGRRLLRDPWRGQGDFRAVPRLIWTYWASGLGQAPDLVRFCVRSWEVMNPGWTVMVLDDSTVARHADLSDLDGACVPVQKRANILRNRLLLQHGGVWADGTILCTAPLDHWLFAAMQTDMFAFSRPVPYRMISTWFLAASPGSRIMRRWDEVYTRYLTDPPIYTRDRPPPYANYNFTFEYLYRTDRTFRADFDLVPRLWAGPLHELQRALQGGELSARPDALPDLQGLPMQKLSWRAPIDQARLASVLARIDPRLNAAAASQTTSATQAGAGA